MPAGFKFRRAEEFRNFAKFCEKSANFKFSQFFGVFRANFPHGAGKISEVTRRRGYRTRRPPPTLLLKRWRSDLVGRPPRPRVLRVKGARFTGPQKTEVSPEK